MGPLHGIKVVEIGVAMAGPFCGMMLGDYGADVVKIERVGVGDDSRHWAPFFEDDVGHYFACTNRSKKSVAVDLKTPEGLAIVRDLIAGADVVVENYRFGALARAGLDYESLKAANPRLIYCSISGFGASGPRCGDPANDLFMQAYSGGMSLTGEVGGSPIRMGLSIADIGAGLFATIGVLMALQARERTGLGQRVDTSLLEGQVSMLSYHLTQYFASGSLPQPGGSGSLIGVPYQAFKTSDEWLVIAVFNDRMWRDFCQAIEQVEWQTDVRFADSDARLENRAFLVDEIGRVIAQKPVAEWQQRLTKYNIPNSPVLKIDDVVADPQVAARDLIVDVRTTAGRTIRMAGLPMKFAGTPAVLTMPPPALGEHTGEVLQSLGYQSDDIAALAARKVVDGVLPVDQKEGALPI